MPQREFHCTTTRSRMRRGAHVLTWMAGFAIALLPATASVGATQSPGSSTVATQHAVLDLRMIVTAIQQDTRATQRSALELWTDPTLSRARLVISSTQAVAYYLRDAAGRWTLVGRADAHSSWRRSTLAGSSVPSLMTQDAVRSYFGRLLQKAGSRVTAVGLGNRTALVFVTTDIAWPYRYGGPVRIWLDRATGLPLRFRTVSSNGPDPRHSIVTITAVDSIRTISSASLPANFFTPPIGP